MIDRAAAPTSPTQATATILVSHLLAAAVLGEPYTKQLDGKLRELRFYLERQAIRITYWIASDRRIILLTVFRKMRTREELEVDRARRALARCMDEAHTADEES